MAPGLVSLVDEGGERLEEDDQGAGRKRRKQKEGREEEIKFNAQCLSSVRQEREKPETGV